MGKNRPLQIALDCRYTQGGFPGIGRYVYNLAGALATLETERDFNLSLICNPISAEIRHYLPDLLAKNPDRVRLLQVEARPISPQEQWELPRLAFHEKFDVWHAPYYVRPYIMPCKTVLTAYDLIARGLPETLPGRKARLAFEITTRLAFLTSPQIITLSQTAAQDITALYKVNPKRLKIIPAGVEEKFQPINNLEERRQIKAELNLPEEYILYVGINKPHKNLGRLIEAYNLYRSNNPTAKVELVLAGKEDPRYSGALRAKVRELGLEKLVHFEGEVSEEDLIKLYGCARLFVMPSLYEGFGLPLVEAQACGIPVICANNTSLPEAGGAQVPTFNPYNVTEIAANIGEMLDNEALLAQHRELGLARAAQLTWQKAATATFEVYVHTASV